MKYIIKNILLIFMLRGVLAASWEYLWVQFLFCQFQTWLIELIQELLTKKQTCDSRNGAPRPGGDGMAWDSEDIHYVACTTLHCT